MSDIISSPPQKSKYASQLAYEKRKLATDPEFRKKKQQRSAKATKKRYQNDDEYRKRVLEYQKQRRDALKESHKTLQILLSQHNHEQLEQILQSYASTNASTNSKN